ncbi:acyl carrier protein [Streptomyces inhibens]|uniref:acyl carrier protein n=1 Tax=Streptomyces inhibens TaxID=2293571 RepID=UPI0036A657DC
MSSRREQIRSVWEQTLGHGHFTDDESFSVVGGRCLLAAQVTARINRVAPARIAVRDLFDHPTVTSVAALIASRTVRARRGVVPSRLSPSLGCAGSPRVGYRSATHQRKRGPRIWP